MTRGASISAVWSLAALVGCTWGGGPARDPDTVDGGGADARRFPPPLDAAPPRDAGTDASPRDALAADARPADARPADARPADARPADARPADAAVVPPDAGPPPSDAAVVPPDAAPDAAPPEFVPDPRCFGPPDPGPCDAFGEAWAFDAVSGACNRFVNGGCLGPGNSFATEEDCRAACVGPTGCVVSVDRLDDDGRVLGSTECAIERPAETCLTLATCICAFLVEPAQVEHCIWAIYGPRALEALSDYCSFRQMTLAEAVAIQTWQDIGPTPFRATAGAACAALPAN